MCSVLSDSVTLWTVAHQAPLSMGFSRQEYWSGLPFPPSGLEIPTLKDTSSWYITWCITWCTLKDTSLEPRPLKPCKAPLWNPPSATLLGHCIVLLTTFSSSYLSFALLVDSLTIHWEAMASRIKKLGAILYSWPSNHRGLDGTAPLMHGFFFQ